jgi:antitoxin MazE
MTTSIVKWGNSRGIRLPKVFLENLDLKENDKVDIISEDDLIIIKKSQKSQSNQYKTLKKRLEDFHGKDIEAILTEADKSNQQPVVIDWGKPIGNEVW